MSGLEGIAALGLACNILQLIGAVGNTITVAKNILESGTIDPDLEKRTDELTTLFRDAEGSLSRTSQHKDDQELRVAAGQVLKATTEFKSELAKISGDASKGKIRQVIRGTVKGFWRRQQLDKLEAEISRCRGMFESRLLLSLRHRVDLGALQREESFNRLDNSLQNFVKGLSDGHTKLEELTNYQSTTVMAHVTEESRQTRQEISTAMNSVVLKMSQEEEQRFVGSLRYDAMNERRNRVEVAHSGTYEWIFCDRKSHNDGPVPIHGIPEFIKSPSEKMYWISGKPGSGKSTLMRFMIENSRMKDLLDQTSSNGTGTIASHFIWAAGAPIQRSLRGTLSSLLFQLVTTDEGALDNLLSKCSNNPQRLSLGDWSDQQLAESLKTVCSSSRSVICLFIDGLDEIDSDDTDKVLAIIDDLCTLTYVKCIVSSRPEQIFSRHFRQLETPSLRMQDLTARDIRHYVEEKLRSWSHNPDRHHDVVDTLCGKAGGVFLWVALALKSQRLSADYEDDPEIVARRFKQLPSGLSELYSNMWDRLNDDKAIYGEEGAKYLNTYLEEMEGDDRFRYHMDVLKMAFATHPALTLESLKPPTPSILEHVERSLERIAVWVEVRTAGLMEVNPDTKEIQLVHRSVLEFLQNDAKGLEITKLDPKTKEERKLSMAVADLVVVKHECDLDRMSEFVSLEHRKIQDYELCSYMIILVFAILEMKRFHQTGKITKASYYKVLDQAASTYHAIRFLANKYPLRQCEVFMDEFSGDYLGFMAIHGVPDYISKKIEEYSTEKTLSMRYLEYLCTETCRGTVARRSIFDGLDVSNWQSGVELGQRLLSLLPQHNSPSPASLLGSYQRTATGLVCLRPFTSASGFWRCAEAALQMKDCVNFPWDASPEHHILLKVPGNSYSSRSNHSFYYYQEVNVFIELPLKMLVEVNDWEKRRMSPMQPSASISSDFSETLIPEMTELKPGLLIIQSWVSSSQSTEFFDVVPEKYFCLKTEEDESFETTCVIQQSVRAALGDPRMIGAALEEFMKGKIADGALEAISKSQFEEILVERGHAFRPSQENPWPPVMFEGIAGPGVEDDPGTEDYHVASAGKEGYHPQVYEVWLEGSLKKVVIEGDVLRVV